MAQPTIGAQASRLARDLTLNSPASPKATLPKLIYGTAWKKEKTQALVYEALKTGFRGVDTAAQPKHYDEGAVGNGIRKAISDGIIKREDLFLQTKFTSPAGQSGNKPYDGNLPLSDMVHMSIKSSMNNLSDQLSHKQYLDSLVMHSPMGTIADTLTAWKTMESYCPESIRALGISNVSLPILKALYQEATIKPSVVQNRFYPDTGYEVALREFCRENDIVFQSFWTLTANPRLVKGAPVANVAQKAGVQPVAAYYALVMGLGGITVLDGTNDSNHMKEDLEGIEIVGAWSEGEGKAEWEQSLKEFKAATGEA